MRKPILAGDITLGSGWDAGSRLVPTITLGLDSLGTIALRRDVASRAGVDAEAWGE
jgi:hypothetical protein